MCLASRFVFNGIEDINRFCPISLMDSFCTRAAAQPNPNGDDTQVVDEIHRAVFQGFGLK